LLGELRKAVLKAVEGHSRIGAIIKVNV
jgi:hypothetical protein